MGAFDRLLTSVASPSVRNVSVSKPGKVSELYNRNKSSAARCDTRAGRKNGTLHLFPERRRPKPHVQVVGTC